MSKDYQKTFFPIKKEIKSFSWDKVLTIEEIKTFEEGYGDLVNGLGELAALIRFVDKHSTPSPTLRKLVGIVAMPSEAAERGPLLLVSHDNYKDIMRVHYSTLKLRPFIDLQNGYRQAKEFYNELRNVLSYQYTAWANGNKSFDWNGSEGKAEGIAEQVESWYRNQLSIFDTKNKIPHDLIDLSKAIELYERSRTQLKRDINNGLIKDYRITPKSKHLISKKEADLKYLK